jgi:hypothetical protein
VIGGNIEARVLHSLDLAGVPYEVVRIDPAFADTAAFCEKFPSPAGRGRG